MPINIEVPEPVVIVNRTKESSNIFTLSLQFLNEDKKHFQYIPGQFNMLYLYGVGESAISISLKNDDHSINHTIRAVGRVTKGFSHLKKGDTLGLRGPYGNGWPIDKAKGKDVLVITGGLGCAPSMSAIHHVIQNRDDFGRLFILQGIKHSKNLIFEQYYKSWSKLPNVDVHLAADHSGMSWPWYRGMVTELLDDINIDPDNILVMICGPEPMMKAAAVKSHQIGIDKAQIYLSLERNMSCALGHCGHCQMGDYFVCRDGPIFSYDEIEETLSLRGV